jgi:hypothetical protein
VEVPGADDIGGDDEEGVGAPGAVRVVGVRGRVEEGRQVAVGVERRAVEVGEYVDRDVAVEGAGDHLDPAHDRVDAMTVIAQGRRTHRESANGVGVEIRYDELVAGGPGVVVRDDADRDQAALAAGLERDGQFSAHRNSPLRFQAILQRIQGLAGKFHRRGARGCAHAVMGGR